MIIHSNVLNLKRNPFSLLLFATFILMLTLAWLPGTGMEFQDKTAYGLPLTTVIWTIPLFLLSTWLCCELACGYLRSKAITWIHVLFTVASTILLVAVLYVGVSPAPFVRASYESVGNAIQILSMTFILGQGIFIANIALGLIRRPANGHK